MEKKKVLIVDDSEIIRQQIGGALERAGFAVVEARDGVEGLECVARDDLCMVVLDVNMLRMNGLEMLEQMKTSPKSSRLPVLMLTTEVQQSLIERARKAGARGWMIKPVNLDHLVSTVIKFTGT